MEEAQSTLARTQTLRGRIERGDVMIGVLSPDAVDAMVAGYEEAGAAGAPEAWRELGECFAYGIGVRRDLDAATRAWQKAVAMNDRASALALVHTRMLLQNEGADEARQIIEGLLHDDDDGQAHLLAGWMRYRGFGCEPDPAASVALHRKAATLGNVDAMLELYVLLSTGQGVDMDEVEALEHCRRAADLGHPRACYNLGAAHATGRGVAQDWDASVEWYAKAAHAGSGRAAVALTMMYRIGDGVAKDPAESQKWAALAAELGFST